MRNLKNIFLACLTTLSFICGATQGFASDGPRFDMASNGKAAAAWISYVSGGVVVQASYKVGTSWSDPEPISDVNSVSIDYPIIRVISNGTSDVSAVVVWTAYNGTVTALYGAILPSSSNGWTNPRQISSNDENVVNPQFDLRVNENGDAIAVWSSYDSLNNQYVRSSTSQVDATNVWTTPEYVSGP